MATLSEFRTKSIFAQQSDFQWIRRIRDNKLSQTMDECQCAAQIEVLRELIMQSKVF